MLDPPPPKPPKGSQVDDTSTGFHDPEQAAAAGALPVYCDRSYPVPDGQDVWARYDPNAQRLRTTLESGPARHAVRRRVTLDYDTWEELEDMADPRQAGTERLCACVPAGKHRTRNIATLLFYELPSTGGTGCGGCIMPCRPCSETRNIRKPATAAQDDGGLGYWARVDVDQSHHQLPHDGGPAWESVVRGGAPWTPGRGKSYQTTTARRMAAWGGLRRSAGGRANCMTSSLSSIITPMANNETGRP